MAAIDCEHVDQHTYIFKSGAQCTLASPHSTMWPMSIMLAHVRCVETLSILLEIKGMRGPGHTFRKIVSINSLGN